MRNRRLLLLSNSRNSGQEYLEHAINPIRELLGDRIRSAIFIPFASVLSSFDDFASRVRQGLASTPYELLSLHEAADPKDTLRKAEAIIVGGGNTFYLLNTLYEHDLLPAIRDCVRNG